MIGRMKKELIIIIKLLFPEAFIERICFDSQTNDWNIYTYKINVRSNERREKFQKYRNYLIREFGINHVFFEPYEN